MRIKKTAIERLPWPTLKSYTGMSVSKMYICMDMCVHKCPSVGIYNQAIGLMSRVFANGLGDQGSIPGQVRPKTQKMALDTALLNTQH